MNQEHIDHQFDMEETAEFLPIFVIESDFRNAIQRWGQATHYGQDELLDTPRARFALEEYQQIGRELTVRRREEALAERTGLFSRILGKLTLSI